MTPQVGSHPQTTSPRARALGIRLFLAMLATQELLIIYIGVQLGLYEALAEHGGMTASQLAAQASISPRYAREWLEQQAVAGFLAVDDAAKPPDQRLYILPAEHEAVLRISDSPLSMVSLAVLPAGGVARALPQLLEAYRTGAGVPDSAFGDEWRDGHSGTNRAFFTHMLGPSIRRFLPDIDRRLCDAGARIADIGCGAGWASISLAQTYPRVKVDGIDVDAVTIERARKNAAGAGVADRVTFTARDGADLADAVMYDLVCLFDTLHELPRPVEVLRACRARCVDGGAVLVMDAKVADTYSAPGDEIERFQYATSLLHCLPVALAEQPSAGTGTVLRADMVRELAAGAGFRRVQIVPINDRFHRFYRLSG